jgi:type I pantothenate kinase
MTHSPYLQFSRDEWRQFRLSTPLSLTEEELTALRGFNEIISLTEVADIYLPLSRLISLYVKSSQNLYAITGQFLHNQTPRVPYIIGVCGSVAVGKSTSSRVLQALLSHGPDHPHVEVVTTDGFLYPNEVLAQKGLMERKGFPESFDRAHLVEFLHAIKSGESSVSIPIYSHEMYDILPTTTRTITNPDILIVEGLNILQTPSLRQKFTPELMVSDFLDFSIYVDAHTDFIENWFLQRFLAFREEAHNKPEKFFHQFAQMPHQDAIALAKGVWEQTNKRNLYENILPFKNRARLILHKNANHSIERVELRKL